LGIDIRIIGVEFKTTAEEARHMYTVVARPDAAYDADGAPLGQPTVHRTYYATLQQAQRQRAVLVSRGLRAVIARDWVDDVDTMFDDSPDMTDAERGEIEIRMSEWISKLAEETDPCIQ
jgi:hypothetical protein